MTISHVPTVRPLTIWKFPFEIVSEQVITLPDGALRVKHVGLDPNGRPCLWCEIDKNRNGPDFPLRVFVIGTGALVPEDARSYLGTFVQNQFVWHVYCDNENARSEHW